MKANRGLANPLMVECARLPFGKCLCGKAALTQEVQFANCIDHRHEVMFEGMTEHGHYCTPIIYLGKTIGVFNIYTRAQHIYDLKDVDFLQAIADALAGIISRKKAEKEKAQLAFKLQQSQKMEAIGTLAGGIAHDFNNILSAIIGYTDLVLYNLSRGDEAEIAADLEQVLKAGKRAQELVRQILAFSRQSVLDKAPLCLGQIVKEVLKLLKASFPSTIEIRRRIPSEVETLKTHADAIQIHQVIMNLCTNAKHAMPDGGILEVVLEKVDMSEKDVELFEGLSVGAFLHLVVRDTGCGMDEVTRKQIFDPFFTTKKQAGTGLGLSMVHGIVKSHGGAISVTSEVGRGTTFNVYLPEFISDYVEDGHRNPVQPHAGNETILFVDDEEVLARMMEKSLQAQAYSVVAVSDSNTAFEMFSADPDAFDVVVTDLTMPDMTGLTMAEKMLRIRPDIPIILCTGYSEKHTEKKAREIGIRKVLLKPLLIGELLEQVRAVCS
jgi:signal transduction histidine kinase